MFKNTASQQWVVFAFQDEGGANPGEPVAADQANITANVRIDAGSANAVDDTNPTVLEGGFYSFGITAAESNGDSIVISPVSTTSNVNVIGVPGAVYTRTDVSGVEAKIDLIDTEVDKVVVATITNAAGTDISADILEVEAQTRKIKKNEAFSDLTFLMVDSTTKDPKTGLTVVEEVSKDGAAFGAAAGSFAEIANGIYQMDATSADMNADILIFRFSATGADDTFVTIVTKP